MGKILIIDNLWHHKMVVVGWCYMCKKAEETADHLLAHCEHAREPWSLLFCYLDLNGQFVRQGNGIVWSASIMWLIWREQNRPAFEGFERAMTELKLILLRTFLIGRQIFTVFCLVPY